MSRGSLGLPFRLPSRGPTLYSIKRRTPPAGADVQLQIMPKVKCCLRPSLHQRERARRTDRSLVHSNCFSCLFEALAMLVPYDEERDDDPKATSPKRDVVGGFVALQAVRTGSFASRFDDGVLIENGAVE